MPDWGGASWAHELGALIVDLRPEHPYFDGPPWHEAIRASGGWMDPREIRVTTFLSADPERIVDHVASISWVAALPADRRTGTIARMRELIQTGQTPAELPVHVILGLAVLA
jgi:hypothetical protein